MDKELSQHQRELQKEARSIVQELSHFVNGFVSESAKIFVDEFSREHRTLQQQMVRIFVEVLKSLVEIGNKGPGWYDLRNEASVKFAQEIEHHLKDAYFPLI